VIVFDTESTGLPGSALRRLSEQPWTIEIAAVKVDLVGDADGPHVFETFHELVKPGAPITAQITQITGITNEMVREAPPFSDVWPRFADFVRGETVWVAHNCAHDVRMLELDLAREQAVTRFPWPTVHVCTVEHTKELPLVDRKLTTLYKYLFDEPLKQTHRALDDVAALAKVTSALVTRGVLHL